jgi:hypothetical protein
LFFFFLCVVLWVQEGASYPATLRMLRKCEMSIL